MGHGQAHRRGALDAGHAAARVQREDKLSLAHVLLQQLLLLLLLQLLLLSLLGVGRGGARLLARGEEGRKMVRGWRMRRQGGGPGKRGRGRARLNQNNTERPKEGERRERRAGKGVGGGGKGGRARRSALTTTNGSPSGPGGTGGYWERLAVAPLWMRGLSLRRPALIRAVKVEAALGLNCSAATQGGREGGGYVGGWVGVEGRL